MLFDLHIHSHYSSDGYLSPQMIIKTALKRGLSGVAVTDHNTINGGKKTSEYLNRESNVKNEQFKVIIGSEVTTTEGEIIGLFLSEDIQSQDPVEVMEEIRSQDGIVVIPHPFDVLRKESFIPRKEHLKLIDKIEVFNSRCIKPEFNHRALEFATQHSLGLTAGSDAHFANEIGKAGIKIGNPKIGKDGLKIENIDIRKLLLENEYQIFGQKSSVINHGFTKVLKIWRKARFG